MGKIFQAVRAKAIISLRVGWIATLLGLIFLTLMLLGKISISSSSTSSFIMRLPITPNQEIAILLAFGALLMSYELFTAKTSRTRIRAVFRALTEEDIYLLYTSPLSAWDIVLINLLSNIIIFFLIPAPLGLGLIVSMVPVYGIETLYLFFYSLIILTLACVHGLSLYMLLQSPKGLLMYDNVRKLYFIILGLTLIGPAIANTGLYFISPSATFANAILELLKGTPGTATILSVIYSIAPLYLLYIFSREDYIIKPLDIISITHVKEIYKVRVHTLRDFTKLIYSRTPTMILSYVLLPIAFIPLVAYYVHFLSIKFINNVLSSIMIYVILLVTFSPAELVYYSGVIVGLSGWLIKQATLPDKYIFREIIRESIIHTLPQTLTLIILLGIESLLYGLSSKFFNDFLTAIMVVILLIPILNIETRISIMRGLKLYMKSGNLPLAVDSRVVRSAEEEMKDRMIFALHILPLFGAAIMLSYGIMFIISRTYLEAISMIIAGIVMYIISITLAKVAEKVLRV